MPGTGEARHPWPTAPYGPIWSSSHFGVPGCSRASRPEPPTPPRSRRPSSSRGVGSQAAGVAPPGEQYSPDPVRPGVAADYPEATPATRTARKTRAPSAGTPSLATSAAGTAPAATLPARLSIAIIALITAPLRAAAGHAAPSAAAWPTLPAGPRTPAAPAAHRRSGQSPTAPTGTPRSYRQDLWIKIFKRLRVGRPRRVVR